MLRVSIQIVVAFSLVPHYALGAVWVKFSELYPQIIFLNNSTEWFHPANPKSFQIYMNCWKCFLKIVWLSTITRYSIKKIGLTFLDLTLQKKNLSVLMFATKSYAFHMHFQLFSNGTEIYVSCSRRSVRQDERIWEEKALRWTFFKWILEYPFQYLIVDFPMNRMLYLKINTDPWLCNYSDCDSA